ncbi:FUSC family protein [Dyella flava]|uniref:FUSC family protein n=1 Tax=Dyella flava TaxID=1920170 RepID=A0ABS2K251_9GAMM|nr:FUSC family protein [Dyella flava]MBM7124969.1 FUSC family protein [Dyella flava]
MRTIMAKLETWLDRIDPGTHRRIKGLRLVTAYGIALALGALRDVSGDIPSTLTLGALAGNFALWASVSEARSTRYTSSRDLTVLCIAAAVGASSYALCAPWLQPYGHAWPEIILVVGAFMAGYLKRYGITGAGIGSQIYIGQLLAYGGKLTPMDMQAIGIAMCIAIVSSVVPRLLSGPAEQPILQSPLVSVMAPRYRTLTAEIVMGLQAAVAALVVVILNGTFGLLESEWAITACVYVIAGTSSGTMERVRRRIIGTLIGVPLGLVCLPLAANVPLLLWGAASLAMIIYAMALPERYDVACGAFAFVLMVTLAVSGEHSTSVLFARAWETVLGGVLGLTAASFLFPLRAAKERDTPVL